VCQAIFSVSCSLFLRSTSRLATAWCIDDDAFYLFLQKQKIDYDIAIFSKSDDPLVHLQHLEAVLASLREHQLLAKGSRCEFIRPEAEFLGFMVSGDGVRPLPSKIESVLQIPVPETITHLRSFLGMCIFFARTCPPSMRSHHSLQSCSKAAKVAGNVWRGRWSVITRLHSSKRC